MFVDTTLTELGRPGERFHLLADREYTVGRKDTDILILRDPSISRKHAVVKIHHPESSLAKPHDEPELKVTDVSKLGTEVKNERFKGASRSAENGDVILFGTQGDSKFSAHYEAFVITTSCIAAAAEKRSVKLLVLRLGGHQVQEWRRECNLLVMSSLNVTVKVICALVSQKPIVTPQYLQDLIKAYETKSAPPEHDKYLPPLAESQLDPSEVSFKPNAARQTLLTGKIFIFLSSKQFKKLSLVIELAGGVPMLMEEGTDDNDDSILTAPGTCVMSNDALDGAQLTPNAHDWSRHVLRCLDRHKKRMITDPEIGYAILYCSTEKHCNPDASTGSAVGKGPVSQSLSQAQPDASEHPEILAPNTEVSSTVNRTRNYSRQEVTHVEDSEAVKIKEEPVTPGANNDKAPPQKAATGAGSQKRVREDEEEATARSKRQARSPVTVKTEHLSQHTVIGNSGTSADQASSRTRDSTRKEVDNFEWEDFDSLPKRKSRDRGGDPGQEVLPARRGRKSERNVSETTGATGSSRKEPTGDEEDPLPLEETLNSHSHVLGDNMDDFDAIPSRKARRQRETTGSDVRYTDSVKQESTTANDFDAIPARKPRKPRVGETAASEESDRAAVKSPTDVAAASDVRRAQTSRIKHERGDELPSTSGLPSSSTADGRGVSGFLSAHNVDLNAVKISECNKEEDLESGCVVVQEKSLVVRRADERRPAGTPPANNTCMWKGKLVKNFKRFRKSGGLEEGLPRIIGGSDLVAHENRNRQERDDWLLEEQRAESQRIEAERAAETLFQFEYTVPSRKRKR